MVSVPQVKERNDDMLTIEKTVLPSPEQWEIIIEGMRNPMNSWDRMDSEFDVDWIDDSVWPHIEGNDAVILGDNDYKLMTSLAKGGPVHAKYRRMIPVYLTINAPLYWWKEFDTYKVGTVANSCSTMHKIQAKEFTMDDFSHEHLFDFEDDHIPEDLAYLVDTIECDCGAEHELYFDGCEALRTTILAINFYRAKFIETKDKRYWWQMIQLLPTCYNQKRTVMLNYEVLVNIYHSRKNHKLDEWHTFCDWIEELPYAELITGGDAGV